MTNTGSGLRSRKIDFKKRLICLRYDQCPDLDEMSLMNRAIPVVATGVEKEEEEEHHLQAALATTGSHVVIPTPDASSLYTLENFESYYTADFHLPKALIKYGLQVEQSMGCLYNADDADQKWFDALKPELKKHINMDILEQLIFAFESVANDKVSDQLPPLEECTGSLNENLSTSKETLNLVYEYWHTKRTAKKGRLRPILKSEEMSTNPDADPYVCFRHREIKTFRKVRRSDTVALDKLKRLKSDLQRLKEILDLVKQRETMRKSMLELDEFIFEKRLYVRRIKKNLGINTADIVESPEKPKKRVRKFEERQDFDPANVRIPIKNIQAASQLVTDMDASLFDDGRILSNEQKNEEKIKRERATDERNGYIDQTEFPYIQPIQDSFWGSFLDLSNSTTAMTLNNHTKPNIMYRRRIGRGGRVIIDRCAVQNPVDIINILSQPTSRAFHIAPKDDQYIRLHNAPAHPNTFDPTKPVETPPTSPIQVIRQPATTAAATATPTGGVKKKIPKTEKRKRVDLGDARQQAVKSMMKQAQKQALHAQAQIQLQNGTSV